jgi:hypothetical protein
MTGTQTLNHGPLEMVLAIKGENPVIPDKAAFTLIKPECKSWMKRKLEDETVYASRLYMSNTVHIAADRGHLE